MSPVPPSGSSRDVPLERPAAGAARLGRRPAGIPWDFKWSRTTHGGDRRSPISGGTLREGPLAAGVGEAQRSLRRVVRALGAARAGVAVEIEQAGVERQALVDA